MSNNKDFKVKNGLDVGGTINTDGVLTTTTTKHTFNTPYGYIRLGPSNSSWGHIETDRSRFYFNKGIDVNGTVKKYNGAEYWHPDNDGSGSGLDADTVDGIQGANFLRSDTSDTMSGNLTVTGQLIGGLGAATTSGTTDWNHSTNARSGNGYTLLLGSHTNGPSGAGYYHPVTYEYNSKNGNGNMSQFAIPYSGTDMFLRTRYSGSWSGWSKFWNSGNDGSTSGLDADLLDGQHGSYYYPASNPNGYTNDQTAAEIRTKIASSPLTATHLAAGSVGASELNVSGNGTTTQYLRSDGDGSMSWVTPPDTVYTLPTTVSVNVLSANLHAANSGVDNGFTFWGTGETYSIKMGSTQANHGTVTDYSMHHNMGTTAGRGFTFGSSRTAVSASINALTGAAKFNDSVTSEKLIITPADGDFDEDGDTDISDLLMMVKGQGCQIHADGGVQTGIGFYKDGATGDGGVFLAAGNASDTGSSIVPTIHLTKQSGATIRTSLEITEGLIRGSWELDAANNDWVFYRTGTEKVRFASNGDLTASGNVTAYSDERLKDNIETITSPLDKVKALRGVTFDKDGERGLGVIAQETEAVIPEVVLTADDEMGTKSVAYGNMVGLLIEAIKEQQTQIDDLKLKLEELT